MTLSIEHGDTAVPRTAAPLAYPHADLELARSLERTEGSANAAFVEAHAAFEPQSEATWTRIAGVYVMYDGTASPLTQTFGLGLFDAVGDDELAAIERFFTSRGAPVCHEVSPYIEPELIERLGRRGYRPLEYSTVLVRPTEAPPPAHGAVTVHRIADDERAVWSRTAGRGWGSESAELAAFVEAFGQVITRARDVHCFLAELGGEAVAAGALSVSGDVALLAGASTIPAQRRQGAQQALLEARLHFARERGARLAMIVAQPGSVSQRNAERQGFRVVYTRTKWRLA